MILQRDISAKRLKQQQYRQQLYNQLQSKKILKSKSRIVEHQPPKQTFSLIKNIEDEQQRRKNKQKQYYVELERQRQQELELKKRKLEEQKRKEKEMEMKIQRDNEMLNRRYEEEKKRQEMKKNIANERAKEAQEQYAKKQQQKTERPRKARNQNQNRNRAMPQQFPQDSLDQIRIQPPNQDAQLIMSRQVSELPVTFAYPSRIQNQEFNFPQRRVLSTNFYRELQLEKRKLQEQANSLRQLNRYLGSQKTYTMKKTQGLESLKQLEKMLDDQNSNLKQEYHSQRQPYSLGLRSSNQYSRLAGSDYYNF